MTNQAKDEPALRYDAGKPPISLVPPEAILALAEVSDFGAKKYSVRNWEKGMSYSRMYDSCQRHLLAYLGGEYRDTESNLPHLYHALWNIAGLITFHERNMDAEFNDMPVGSY